MSTLVIGRDYPGFEAEVTRSQKGTTYFPLMARHFRASRFSEDLASLHSVSLRPDVGIISAIQQLPKISANDPSAVVDVAKILSTKTLIPSFPGSRETVQEFSSIYNGKGLRRVARTLGGATISRVIAEDLLASILEDALIATSSHLMTDGSNIVSLDQEDEFVLESAIAERLPRIYEEDASAFASKLLNDLKRRIGTEGALAIDDGAVFLTSNKLHMVDVGDQPIHFKNLD